MKWTKEIYRSKLIDIFSLFLVGGFIGWLYEVILHLVMDGSFVNRGMLHGPWLPIYGLGCILMVSLKYWAGKTIVSYFWACFFASAVLEYVTSWLMEAIYHNRWWDYSKLPLNLNGRVFLGGLLGFALIGCLLSYVLLPGMKKMYCMLPQKLVNFSAYLLVVIFILDVFISIRFPNMGVGVTR